jgi:hypothetical protein
MTTWNPSDLTANITLSSGNLTATCTAAADNGVRATPSKTSGKYYVEFITGPTFAGGDTGVGIATSTANLGTIGLTASGGLCTFVSGSVYFNGTNQGISMGPIGGGTNVGLAVDLVNSTAWFRVNGGNWNASGTANPATNTGGINIAALFPFNAVFLVFCSNSNGSSVSLGLSSFVYAPPSGFPPWDPVTIQFQFVAFSAPNATSWRKIDIVAY